MRVRCLDSIGKTSQNVVLGYSVVWTYATKLFHFLGSGLLVNTVTAGLIMIIKPFSTTRRPFIKDTLFYMSAVCWSAVILVRRVIYLSDSVGKHHKTDA